MDHVDLPDDALESEAFKPHRESIGAGERFLGRVSGAAYWMELSNFEQIECPAK
jgi:hypothetical protein